MVCVVLTDHVLSASVEVGIAAAVRAPRAEMRSKSILDFGVVRAHSRHALKVEVTNPTELPMLLQLRQFKAGFGRQQAYHFEPSSLWLWRPKSLDRTPSATTPSLWSRIGRL